MRHPSQLSTMGHSSEPLATGNLAGLLELKSLQEASLRLPLVRIGLGLLPLASLSGTVGAAAPFELQVLSSRPEVVPDENALVEVHFVTGTYWTTRRNGAAATGQFRPAENPREIGNTYSYEAPKLLTPIENAIGGWSANGMWLRLFLSDAVLGAAGAATPMTASPLPCASLKAVAVAPARIGLPTRGAIISRAAIEERGACLVDGAIRPVDSTSPAINFRIALPAEWNGKAVHVGGGGLEGNLLSLDNLGAGPGLRELIGKGYALFWSDSGHQDAADGFDASFALNREAFRNYAGDQLKKVRDTASEIVRLRYGSAPRRTYFFGASQGGHQGLIVAARYPEDYDGVIAWFPTVNPAALALSVQAHARQFYRSPAYWLSPDKTRAIGNAVLRACDDLDGLPDGIIANIAACRRRFQVSTLRCAGGADLGAQCLSDSQLATARFLGRRTLVGGWIAGTGGFSGYPIFEGGFTPGTLGNLGTQPVPKRPPGPNDALPWRLADLKIRYMIAKDPTLDGLAFQSARHKAEISHFANAVGTASANLDRFRRRGGKLLLFHGTVDMAIPPGNTVDYYGRLRARYGSALTSLARFYLVPGLGHGDGAFRPSVSANWQGVAMLDDWVERGDAPFGEVLRDESEGHRGRTRPLCEYPLWARYKGAGAVDDAANFECAR